MYDKIISTEAELRDIVGHPHQMNLGKGVDHINALCRELIAKSPFLVIGSYNIAQEKMDVSPKGDPAGFVWIENEKTLIIPERPGNRLADTFTNVLSNPNVSLIFLIPGNLETLRVRGKAKIVIDEKLSAKLAVKGRKPKLLLVVTVENAFMHCGKCMARSKLWQPEAWLSTTGLPTIAQSIVEHNHVPEQREELEKAVVENYKNDLY